MNVQSLEQNALNKKTDIKTVPQHILEIVSDSGEGTQTAGQIFGIVSAKMGNGVWTVEIIPAEIEPPQRSKEGASGNRIRLGTNPVGNMGDCADVVVALNEQVPYSRIDVGAFKEGTLLLLENKWQNDPDTAIQESYKSAVKDFASKGYEVIEIPMEEDCLKIVPDPRRGKNIWVLGLLSFMYSRDMGLVKEEVSRKFFRKGQKVIDSNLALLDAGFKWAEENLGIQFEVPVKPNPEPLLVSNGNQAIALGSMAAGFELCSMYPITPATSASHYLASVFEKVGGFVHQAEDEIAAIGFAIGASYAGKTALTITSGPGLALKTEFIGLAVMAEIPLVIVDVQRGGPSTGLPTRVEQGDLLASLNASPGDSPKIVMAAATIEECFHFMVTARKLAELFRGPVIVLTDANLATGVQPFPKPKLDESWLSPPIDQSPWDPEVKPFDWDEETGLSQRPIPGQKNGNYVLTGLAHNSLSKIAYQSSANQHSMEKRSAKFRTFQKSLNPPEIHGDASGDMLIVGWGSTLGAIEEAVDRLREEGKKVSSIHLRYLFPMEPGLKEIFSKFKKVMTVEINYSDPVESLGDSLSERRYAQLASLLRSQTLVDVDSWSRVPGIPLSPGVIEDVIREKMNTEVSK